MAASMNSVLCFTTATITIIILILPLPSATCFTHPPSLSKSEDPSKQGLLSEEKTRLGSRPPSCHSKCNECHPCMAVQVPTIPKRVVRGTQSSRETIDPATDEFFYLESSSGSGCNNRYSNYKPLGWKCRCRNHFYNP